MKAYIISFIFFIIFLNVILAKEYDGDGEGDDDYNGDEEEDFYSEKLTRGDEVIEKDPKCFRDCFKTCSEAYGHCILKVTNICKPICQSTHYDDDDINDCSICFIHRTNICNGSFFNCQNHCFLDC